MALGLTTAVVNAITVCFSPAEGLVVLCMSGSVVHWLIDVPGATLREEVRFLAEKRGQGGMM